MVKAKGIYRSGPGVSKEEAAKESVSQKEVEYFTHLSFEAPGDSPYGWMNGIVAIGVMIMVKGKPVIDCYRLTNFPSQRAERL